MREILFRGKGTSGYCAGEWVYGYYCYDFWGKKDHGILPVDKNCGGYCEVTPETVGQYTGLTDKNGKKIFEGDICRFREWKLGDMCWIGKVYFEHQHFVISGEANKECETPFTMVMSCFASGDIEVIGNIHDNPELLGGADNG